MGKIRVGVIGVGSFGELHVAAYQTLWGVEVTALCDPREERLREVGERYGIVGRHRDYRELCAREDVDLVSVVTPEGEHRAPALAAASQGKHLFVEKPLATTLEDGEAILQAASQAGVQLMVGHLLRFENKYATVKRLLEEGRLGRVVSLHARRNRPRSLYQVYGNRIHALLVNAIHDIDLFLWYTGDRVRRVRGHTRNIQGGKYPDINWGFLEFSQGAVACLETHWLIPEQAGVMTDDALQLLGTEGVAEIRAVPSGLHLWTGRGQETVNVSYDAWFHGQIRGPLKEELAYFVECVRRNRPPQVMTGREALEALKVALALIRSASEERDVPL